MPIFEKLFHILWEAREMRRIHPLLIAAKKGDVSAAKALLDAGANVNMRSGRGGVTPLMTAAALGHLKIVELLLQHKPNLNLTHRELPHCGSNGGDFKAVDYAVYHRHTRVAAVLRLAAIQS